MARAFTETYGGLELWRRLAHLAPTVHDHETPLETTSYCVRHTPRIMGQRGQIDVSTARQFLLRAGFTAPLEHA